MAAQQRRCPPIPPDQLTPAQKEIHDGLVESAETLFKGKGVSFQRLDGALIGPFGPLLYTPPAVAHHFLGSAKAIAQIPDLVPAAREAAVLAVGELYRAPYEVYVHETVAEGAGALSKAQIEAIAKGQRPDGEDAGLAWEVARALVKGGGPLEERLFMEAEGRWGREGAMGVMHYVGIYCHCSVVLNWADVPVPEGV